MMLKVEKQQGWAIFDHIQKIDHFPIITGVGYPSFDEDFTYLCPEHKPMVYITITHDDGKAKTLVAYSPAYILNDAGKTVERI